MKRLDRQELRAMVKLSSLLSAQGWQMTPVTLGEFYEIWPNRCSREVAAQEGCLFGLRLASEIAEWEMICRCARPDAYVQYLTGLRALLEDVANGVNP